MSKNKSLPSWTNLTKPELDELRYRLTLSKFIEDVLYQTDVSAQSNNWQLGSLHKEWDFLLQKDRLRVLAPRDHLKTYYFSTAYPALRMRFNPQDEIYIFSKTDRQATKILDKIKRVIKTSPFLQDLSKGDDVDFWTKSEVRCANGATVFAQGYWSAVRGGHPKCIIIDDPIDSDVIYSDEQNSKAKDRFFQDILPMAEPDTQIIFVGTLQREDDLYHALDPAFWTVKTYSAIVDEEKKLTLFPEKWSWDALMRRKAEISFDKGEKFFLKEYCNQPIQALGELIKKEWLQFYTEDQLPEGDDYVGFDLSVGKDPHSGDYFAGVVFRLDSAGNYWWRAVIRARLDFAGRLKKIVEVAGHFPSILKVRIEDNVFQNDTVQLLTRQTNLPIEGVKTTGNKTQRFAQELAPLFENRKVYLKKEMTEAINELLTLPFGKYDDIADAFLIGKKGLGMKVEPNIRFL